MVGRRVFKHAVQSSVYNTLEWPWSAESKQSNGKTERQATKEKNEHGQIEKRKLEHFLKLLKDLQWMCKSTINLSHAYILHAMWGKYVCAYVCVFSVFCPFSISPSPHSSCTNKHCSHILEQISVGLLGMRSLVRPQSMTYYYTQIKPLWIRWLHRHECAICPLENGFYYYYSLRFFRQ